MYYINTEYKIKKENKIYIKRYLYFNIKYLFIQI